MTLFKKIGFALLVFFMSVGIFFLLSNNEQIKTNILRTSLELFGKELLAMVPEGNEKDLLVDRYNQFINKAENDEIPPEKIEKIAATILNLANQDSLISAEKAINALELTDLEPISKDSLSIRSSFIKRVPDFRMPLPFLWKLHDKKHMELANRLTAAREFHVFMRNMSIPDSCLDVMKKHYVFMADSGLRIVMDMNIEKAMPVERVKSLEDKIGVLEEQNQLVWTQDIEPFILNHADDFTNMRFLRDFKDPQFRRRFLESIKGLNGKINIDSIVVVSPDSSRKNMTMSIQIKTK